MARLKFPRVSMWLIAAVQFYVQYINQSRVFIYSTSRKIHKTNITNN